MKVYFSFSWWLNSLGFCLVPVQWWEENENFLACYVISDGCIEVGEEAFFSCIFFQWPEKLRILFGC